MNLELPFVTQELLAAWTARNEIGILEFVPGSSSIYTVAVTGGRAARIYALDGDHPGWSPDDKQLAYTHNGTIWLVSLENPRPVQVETGRAELMATHMDWSPDGKWLVFTGHTGFDRQLHLMTDFMSLVTR